MHEISLSESVLALIEANAASARFTRVLGVRLEIGELAGVEIDALRLAFDAVKCGTLADTAALEIARVPGEAWCGGCHRAVRIAERIAPCPRCGGFGLSVTGGDEMVLKSLEVA